MSLFYIGTDLSASIGQVRLALEEFDAQGFANMNTFELLKRCWTNGEGRPRPKDSMLAHSGSITVAKKAPPFPSPEPSHRVSFKVQIPLLRQLTCRFLPTQNDSVFRPF